MFANCVIVPGNSRCFWAIWNAMTPCHMPTQNVQAFSNFRSYRKHGELLPGNWCCPCGSRGSILLRFGQGVLFFTHFPWLLRISPAQNHASDFHTATSRSRCSQKTWSWMRPRVSGTKQVSIEKFGEVRGWVVHMPWAATRVLEVKLLAYWPVFHHFHHFQWLSQTCPGIRRDAFISCWLLEMLVRSMLAQRLG